MADLVMGAMASLIPKLCQLLKEEYSLQTGLKKSVMCLSRELEGAQAALRKVAEVPRDQLDEQVKLWSREVREASYDMEDILDTFLVRVQDRDSAKHKSLLKRQCDEMTKLLTKSKARHEISVAIEGIKRQLQEVTERRGRFKVDDIVARPATTSAVDPRLAAMYTEVKRLVGIDKSSGELMSMLQPPQTDDMSKTKMKIVSVFGTGGLGKTTLAKAVYEKIKGDYDCWAFVPIGRNPDLKKVFKDILFDLDSKRYLQFSAAVLDERQLINQLRDFFHENKRYLLVIDDIWETQTWETIKLAIVENNCGSRIIITTRKFNVATEAGEPYRLQPLPFDSSRKLLYTRISGGEGKCIDNEPGGISDKILRKCHGIPLAIITMGSLLAGKPKEQWSELYQSIGFGLKDNEEVETTTKILSISYYELPSYLRTCLLYLSAFPEDCFIPKDELVWKWIAEGFVHEKQGIRLYEIGEGYFHELINRSLIQAEESSHDGRICGCHVHDMVLDFIRSVSCEENFFTTLDDDDGGAILQHGTIRRLASHYSTKGYTRRANHSGVRSFVAYRCVIEKWAPLSSLKFLRVLHIEYCNPTDGSRTRIEHLGNLLHLRYLSLEGTKIDKIPEEIGALRMLQTLDLTQSYIVELPSSISLLTQLVRLHVTYGPCAEAGKEVASVGKLTSLEELCIYSRDVRWSTRRLVKELSRLRELRVLVASINYDEESELDLLESLTHLPKLQTLLLQSCSDGKEIPAAKWEMEFALPPHLQHMAVNGVATSVEELVAIRHRFNERDAVDVESLREHVNYNYQMSCCRLGDIFPTAMWEVPGFVLPRHLRELHIVNIKFSKLPSWINPSCLPNLSYLSLYLGAMDEQDLKTLGRLPELLSLNLLSRSSSAAISNVVISDSDAAEGYFQKLRYCRLMSTIWFLPDNDGMSASFHIWNGEDDIAMPFGPGNKGSISNKGTATAPPIMPCLQMLQFTIYVRALRDCCHCDNFGLEYLPSLRTIEVEILRTAASAVEVAEVEAALRHAANVHPNHPTLVISKFDAGNIIPQRAERRTSSTEGQNSTAEALVGERNA